MKLTVAFHEGHIKTAEWLLLHGPADGSPLDADTLAWMNAQLLICTEQHHHEAVSKQSFIPQRLIDVQGVLPRLVIGTDIVTSSDQGIPKYASLSYCWGKPEDAQYQQLSTIWNLHHRQAGIDDSTLSVVQRDAIQLSKALGIPYLWIDSLCILQDDESDWNHQCVMMDKIYGHAYVTFLASASSLCRESFLHPHQHQTQIPFQSALIPNREGKIKLATIGIQDRLLSELYTDLNSRLSSRGWALQESVLSIRRLVFGFWSIHFLCPASHKTLGGELSENGYDCTMELIKEIAEDGSRHAAWDSLICYASQLSKSSFTYPKDILPALSGLAGCFHNVILGKYLAGHWEETLFLSLVWEHISILNRTWEWHIQNIIATEDYIVPSWSVLYKGNVEVRIDHNRTILAVSPELESVNGEVTLAGENPLGAITHAFLEIRSHSFQQQNTADIRSITFEQLEDDALGRASKWLANLTWHEYVMQCAVILDYSSSVTSIERDAKGWKWVLLGSFELKDNSIHGGDTNPSHNRDHDEGYSDESDEDTSETDEQYEAEKAEEDEDECSMSVTDSPSSHSEDDACGNRSVEEEDDEEQPSNRNIEVGDEEEDDEGSRGLVDDERYPYGLLLQEFEDRREWYRVGVFRHPLHQLVPSLQAEAYSIMTLEMFHAMSKVETITVV